MSSFRWSREPSGWVRAGPLKEGNANVDPLTCIPNISRQRLATPCVTGALSRQRAEKPTSHGRSGGSRGGRRRVCLLIPHGRRGRIRRNRVIMSLFSAIIRIVRYRSFGVRPYDVQEILFSDISGAARGTCNICKAGDTKWDGGWCEIRVL